MEFDFDFRRLLLLALLLGGFALFGGFRAPNVPANGFHSAARVNKAWSYCVVLFIAGAVSATLIEHTVGYMDPTNLRPAYIVLGVLLMAAGVFWLHSLKNSVEKQEKEAVMPFKANGLASCSPGLREALPWETRETHALPQSEPQRGSVGWR
ncbi:MAG: hypothetical protein U1F81_20870 [Verrucomicrobiaceae bacterium]